jgi:lipoprotein-releasing system permease protein
LGKYNGWVAVIGIAIGCFAIIISLAVLNGFESMVTEKIKGIEGDMTISHPNLSRQIELKIKDIPGIKKTLPLLKGKSIIINQDKSSALVRIKAAKLDSILLFYPLNNLDLQDEIITNKDNPVIIGELLSQKLQLDLGDQVHFANPHSVRIPLGIPLQAKGKIVGIFKSNVLDHDEKTVFISSRLANSLFSSNKRNGMDIRIDSMLSLQTKKREINEILNEGIVETWEEQHSALVQAMKLEKIGAIIVLSLIIIVACFNLISNLVLIIRQKWRELGILQIMGYTKNHIMSIIINHGLILGCIGCFLGSSLGGFLVLLQTNLDILPLPEDIYFMEALPMSLPISEFLLVPFFAMTLVFFASFLASRRAVSLSALSAIQLEK